MGSTLRKLANDPENVFTLQELLDIAGFAGLSADADAILGESDIRILREKAPAYFKQKKLEAEANKKAEEKRKAASIEILEKLIRNNYIFVDGTSLLEPSAEQSIQLMLPLLKKYNKKLYIPYSVLMQMSAWAEDHSQPDRAELCMKRGRALKKLQEQGIVEIRKFFDENNPARDLITACSHFRLQQPLLVLTQDKKLATDLIRLNYQRAANGKNITIKCINKHGYLSNVIERQGKGFYICDKVREEPDYQLSVSYLPKADDYVYDSPECSGAIRLNEEIGSGGEGTIYKTNTSYVAKIYKEECCTAYRQEKLCRMIEAGLEYRGICFPISMLYNQYGEFVGYLMMKAKGYSIQNSIFRKQLFLKKLPGWKKEDLVQCAITILYNFKYLHDKNILVGDINPNNILVESPLNVYFVDTDSYQINDLPCPVGFPLFTAPELHQKYRNGELRSYSEIMRTKKNEYFAVATLLFQLMLPGKPPYTQQGGDNVVDNILQMKFPYPLKEQHGRNVPDGTWRYIWSNLTHRMKNNFHMVFDGKDIKSDFNIEERIDTDQWIVEMREYHRILKNWQKELDLDPETTEVDPESLKLYPVRLKHQRGVKYIVCRGEDCGKELPEEQMRAGFCPDCQKKGEKLQCIICDNEFIFTNYEKYFRGFHRPITCPSCRRKKEEIYKSFTCKTPGCYNKVEVTYGTYAYLKKNNYSLPKWCPSCRKLNEQRKEFKNQKSAKNMNTSKQMYNADEKATNKAESDSQEGCFITTAICEYLGKSDDCRELTDFRYFRDHWLQFQEGGMQQIKEYYECAPELVQLMHNSPDYAHICEILWSDFLSPCQKMIYMNQFEECRAHYQSMVDYLRMALL